MKPAAKGPFSGSCTRLRSISKGRASTPRTTGAARANQSRDGEKSDSGGEKSDKGDKGDKKDVKKVAESSSD